MGGHQQRNAAKIVLLGIALAFSAAAAAQGTAKPPAAGAKPAAADVDEELLSRALERSLVRSGGVLLPQGVKEFEPGFLYDYTRRSGLAIVGGAAVFQDITRESTLMSIGLRAGLPWSSQIELFVPVGSQRVETVINGASTTDSDSGRGDFVLGWSKQLYQQSDGRAGLIGNVAYQRGGSHTNIGQANAASLPSLSAGYDAVQFRLTGVRRLDPLVFVGSVGHSFNRSADRGGNHIEPAGSNSASFRAILATSPDVSLRTGVAFTRTGDLKLNGATVGGSRQLVSVMEVGGSLVLGRRALLDVSVGAGLTQDSPDFTLAISLPIRF